jgi:flagellar biosynthesis/type III secretory pathway protein FliH
MSREHENLPTVPGGNVMPPEPNFHSILGALAVAFSKMPGAEGMDIGRAHAALESKFAEGFHRGKEQGFRDGYQRGYQEGLNDGRGEALDERAQEEAERATLKAAARAGGRR